MQILSVSIVNVFSLPPDFLNNTFFSLNSLEYTKHKKYVSIDYVIGKASGQKAIRSYVFGESEVLWIFDCVGGRYPLGSTLFKG